MKGKAAGSSEVSLELIVACGGEDIDGDDDELMEMIVMK